MILCMSIEPGYSGQPFMPAASAGSRSSRPWSMCRSRSTAAWGRRMRRRSATRERALLVAGNAVFAEPDPGGRVPRLARRRAHEPRPGARARRRRAAADGAYPNPIVGAVVVADGRDRRRGRHRGVRRPRTARSSRSPPPASARAAHSLRDDGALRAPRATPPCVDAIVAAGVARVVAGCLDPNPEAAGGLERLGAPASRSSSTTASRPAGRTRRGGPGSLAAPVRHLQGRDHARRPRDRAGSALGDRRGVAAPRARAAGRVGCRRGRHGHGPRGCSPARRSRRPVVRQPRRLAFGRGPLPDGSELELRQGRSARSSPRSRPRACSRSCSRAGRRSPRRSWRPDSSTSCSSSWRRHSRAPGRGSSATSPRRRACSTLTARAVSRPTCSLEAYRPRAVGRTAGGGSLSPCSPGSCERSGRSSPSTGGDEGLRLEIEAPVTAPLVGSVAPSRSTASASRRRRSTPTGSCSTPCPRRSRARRSVSSRPGRASTSSRRFAPATRWAATSSRVTSTGSATVRSVEAEGEGLRVIDRGVAPTRCATASRRARSPSRASRSRSRSCTTMLSAWR